jgi:hypothetical protein
MAQTNNTTTVKRRTLSHLFDNNWFVLVFSLVIAVILWCGVSMFQTTEVEKQFVNIKVQLNYEGSLPSNKNLQIFGEQEYYVDVTVKGKSYLVNDEDFADKISASVSFASVTSAGTYALPVTVTVEEPDVEVVNYSRSTVSVYIDEMLEKSFAIEDEVRELSGYSLPEGYARENPRLSVESVTLQGPALEISRVAAVKAVIELDKELASTETFTAEVIYVGTSENANLSNVTMKDEEPVYITIPVTYTASYTPVINFTNVPKDLRDAGIEYKITPESVTMTVATGENQVNANEEIAVGTIDFSEINNERNTFRIPVDESQFTFTDGTKQFVVTVDMTGMHKRWLEISVNTDDLKLPEGATLVTKTIQSVQVIGPAGSVDKIENSEAYAVPVLDDVTLEKGVNVVPVKVVLRTLTDSWVRGEYTVEIRVD